MGIPRVCVSGIGLVTPIGNDPESFWDSLLRGHSGAAPVRSFDTTGLPNRIGCEAGEISLAAAARSALAGGRCTELSSMRCRRNRLSTVRTASSGFPIQHPSPCTSGAAFG